MNANEELIQKFYTAFQNKDGQTMVSLYHPEIQFEDPAFGKLSGKDAGAMWLMLLERSQNLTIRFSNIKANETEGSANWEADYSFSKTGRLVQNKIHAKFTFKDGKIFQHKDQFSMWKWLGMAMGPVGYLLGWWPALGNKVKKEAVTGLQLYMKRKRM